MNNKDFVVNTLKQIGFKIAQELQSNIPDMEATDIIEQEEYLPPETHHKTQHRASRGVVEAIY